ncbi:MAG TPA: alpha/beta fold hydrolase [Candidatus Limnocylindrales bacterium]|nr:alpha/beta fold hydrolase [Candidatus Limnocylindrales bacterium]
MRRVHRLALLGLLGLLVGAAACGGPNTSPTPQPLAFSPCGEAEAPTGEQGTRHKFCAQIHVTESNGADRVVQVLAISNKASDPIAGRTVLVYHPGGPGISAVELVAEDPLAVDMARFTILTWDGTTASQVPGACGPASNAFGVNRDPAKLADEAPKVVKECLGGFGGKDDVGAAAAAAELEAIRVAIGVDKLNVLAVSYGTAIAEDYIRMHGEHVDRAVLDGPLALEVPWSARLQAVGASLALGTEGLVASCTTERCMALANGTGSLAYGALRAALVAQAPPVGGGNTVLTATMIDQATLLALRSDNYWVPWATAVDVALGGDGTDLWALGEKEYFDLDRAVFYRSLCADINVPPDPAAYGTPQDALLRAYTSALAPCAGYPHTTLPAARGKLTGSVRIFASAKDPLTPFGLLASAPTLQAFGTVCQTDVAGHTSLRDAVSGPLELAFVTGADHGDGCAP